MLFNLLLIKIIFASQCTNKYLTNLNSYRPNNLQSLYRTPIPAPHSIDVCRNLLDHSICCDSEGIKSEEDHFMLFVQNLNEQNYKQVQFYNEQMVEILKKKDVIIKFVDSFNKMLVEVGMEQQLLQEVIDQVQPEEDDYNHIDSEENESEGGFEDENVFEEETFFDEEEEYVEPKPVKKKKLQNTKRVKEVRANVDTQLEQFNQLLKQIGNFTIFQNLSFFVEKEINGKKIYQANHYMVEDEFVEMQVRVRNLVNASSLCFTALEKHVLALRCGTCDEYFLQYIIILQDTLRFQLQTSNTVCNQIKSACYPYVNKLDELNENHDFSLFSKVAVEELEFKSNITDKSFGRTLEILVHLQSVLSRELKNEKYYLRPENCLIHEECDYICESYLSSIEVDISELFSKRRYSKEFKSANQIKVNMTDLLNSIFGTNNPSLSGKKKETQINEMLFLFRVIEQRVKSMNYSYFNALNTLEFSEKIRMIMPFDGTSGGEVFNLSGNATMDELHTYKHTVLTKKQIDSLMKVIFGRGLQIIVLMLFHQ